MTNNTSADEQLREEILTEFKQVYKLAPADYTENCTNVVMSIIRTEKLKTKIDLLKTIRRSYPKRRTLQGNAQSKLTLADIDRLIGETKLEAEL